jgi:hypothetical protein
MEKIALSFSYGKSCGAKSTALLKNTAKNHEKSIKNLVKITIHCLAK